MWIYGNPSFDHPSYVYCRNSALPLLLFIWLKNHQYPWHLYHYQGSNDFYNIVSTFGQFYQFNNHIILVFELKNIVAWSIDSPSSLVYLPGRPVSAPSDVHARDIIQRLWVNVFLAKFDYLLLWIIFIINWVKNWNLELIITPSLYQTRKASSNITAS